MTLASINNLENISTDIVASEYIDQLAGSLTKNTKRAYLKDIKQFFGINEFSDLTIDMVRNVNVATANQYFEKLLDEGYANSTINRKLQAISKFYKFMCRREIGVMEYNPFSSDEGSVRLRVKRYSNTRALTDDEVRKIIEVISVDTSIVGIRNKIIILLLATTGMRRNEIAKLKIGSIGKNGGKNVIEYIAKGGKERMVLLADSIYNLIDTYLKLRGLTFTDIEMPLFIGHASNSDPTKSVTAETIYQLIKKVAKGAGLDPSSISPHCFRHTYITKSLDMGCNIVDVQDRVGHADVSTTRRYDHTRRILKDNPADELASIYDI